MGNLWRRPEDELNVWESKIFGTVKPEVVNDIKEEIKGVARKPRGEEYAPYTPFVDAVLNSSKPVCRVFKSFEDKLANPELLKDYSPLAEMLSAMTKAVLGTTSPTQGVYDRVDRNMRVNEFTDLIACSVLKNRSGGEAALENAFQNLGTYKLDKSVRLNLDLISANVSVIKKNIDYLMSGPDIIANMDTLMAEIAKSQKTPVEALPQIRRD